MSYSKAGALRFVEENDVKFIRLQFCDILGNLKNISISPSQLDKAFDEGIAFDASSILGFNDIEDSELFLYPDPTTLCVLPWRPQHGKVARFFCDIKKVDGTPYEGDCRHILKTIANQAKAKGLIFHVGPECEFFLFEQDAEGNPILKPADNATYFDVAPLDQGENTRREICLTLGQMGFEIESSHHESAAGQHEIDFRYSDVLNSADNILSFKSVVKTIAVRNGLHASFMPKPLNNASGSGMHINMSLYKDGENIFTTAHNSGLPMIAQQFIAGILSHIKEITAICNPTVNSYKRITSGFEAPRHISWSFKNRSSLIRIPGIKEGHNRIELRSPDAMCNPYLALALILASGLDGIEKNMKLDNPLTQNAYSLSPEKLKELQVDLLPNDLGEALKFMNNSALTKTILGEHTFSNYIALKEKEWQAYNHTVHNWEIQQYL